MCTASVLLRAGVAAGTRYSSAAGFPSTGVAHVSSRSAAESGMGYPLGWLALVAKFDVPAVLGTNLRVENIREGLGFFFFFQSVGIVCTFGSAASIERACVYLCVVYVGRSCTWYYILRVPLSPIAAGAIYDPVEVSSSAKRASSRRSSLLCDRCRRLNQSRAVNAPQNCVFFFFFAA